MIFSLRPLAELAAAAEGAFVRGQFLNAYVMFRVYADRQPKEAYVCASSLILMYQLFN